MPNRTLQSSVDAGPLAAPAGDLWVFAYGSLMWNPGFRYQEVYRAQVYGYHRALCVWSWVYRGTPREPGLVLGLDTGGSCVGRAFRVVQRDKRAALAYLYEREMISNIYRPLLCGLRLSDHRTVTGLTFQVDRGHPQYAGKLSAERAAATICDARGRNGPNTDYVINTVAHLDELGLRDPLLSRVYDILAGT